MSIRRTIAFGLLFANTATLGWLGASAQDADKKRVLDQAAATHIEQIDDRSGGETATPKQLDLPGASAPAQLGPVSDSASEPPGQLTSERSSAAAGPQVYRGGRTAQPSAPLSSPAQGRPEGTVRLGGEDRCDPRTGADAGKAACANVIESRADEFHRPQPPTLSAEQRLLIYERTGEIAPNLKMLVRQAGSKDVDADAPETQGLASIALTPPAATAKPDEPPSDPGAVGDRDTGALVQAIIETMTAASPH